MGESQEHSDTLAVWKEYLDNRINIHKRISMELDEKQWVYDLIISVLGYSTLALSLVGLGIDLSRTNKDSVSIVMIACIVTLNSLNAFVNELNRINKYSRMAHGHYNAYISFNSILGDISLIQTGKYPTTNQEIIIMTKYKVDHILQTSPLIENDDNIFTFNPGEFRDEFRIKALDKKKMEHRYKEQIYDFSSSTYDDISDSEIKTQGISLEDNLNDISIHSD
jgi:hypothetical protein